MKDNFKPDMTYWQTLRIVVGGLIQFPIHKGDMRFLFRVLVDVVRESAPIFTTIGGWLLRTIALFTLPVSAPILAWLVQIERRRTTARRKEFARKWREGLHKYPSKVSEWD